MFPLILTLRLDKQSSQFFDRERTLYFPHSRNFLAAHVTLFHHIPGEGVADLIATLVDASASTTEFPVAVQGVRFLGRGVAYRLASEELIALRSDLAEKWEGMLTAQDKQKFQPHVTVQNKVESSRARSLFEQLRAGFVPWQARGIGLDLWEYRGGLWEFVQNFAFADASD